MMLKYEKAIIVTTQGWMHYFCSFIYWYRFLF